MASDIHKKRTGKSFKITEEIVLKEEMYEEEDDDLPRSYRLLSSQMETPSRNTNDRLEAFLNNKLAMSTLLAQTNEEWRKNEINQLFAQSFPSIDSHSRQQAQQVPSAPQRPNGHMLGFPGEQNMLLQQQQQYYDFHNQQRQHRVQSMSAASTAPMVNHSPISPRHNSETPAPPFGQQYGQHMQSMSPTSVGSSSSAFTPEMPPEAQVLMRQPEEMAAFDPLMQQWMPAGDGQNDMASVKLEDQQGFSPQMNMMDIPLQKWPIPGTENVPMDDATWNTFIDDGAWLEKEPLR